VRLSSGKAGERLTMNLPETVPLAGSVSGMIGIYAFVKNLPLRE
jgi:hypothetical protein